MIDEDEYEQGSLQNAYLTCVSQDTSISYCKGEDTSSVLGD